jgi:hypothetical protein
VTGITSPGIARRIPPRKRQVGLSGHLKLYIIVSESLGPEPFSALLLD